MLLVAAITALAIWLVPSKEPTVVSLPPIGGESAPASTQPLPVNTAAGQAKPGLTARQLIAEQRSAGKPDPQAAYKRARALSEAGQAADAYLLDFYAARLGHAPSAFALAEQADPAYWQAGGALKAAAPEQARKWYVAADEAGHADAKKRLESLHAWAKKAAGNGNPEAQRLLLAWQ